MTYIESYYFLNFGAHSTLTKLFNYYMIYKKWLSSYQFEKQLADNVKSDQVNPLMQICLHFFVSEQPIEYW